MEIIFDREFRKELISSLKEAGIKEEKAQSIIKSRYNTALKEVVCKKLQQVISFIKEDKYKELSKMCCFSPAGDCMGCDNVYINFSDVCDKEDIGDIINELSPTILNLRTR